MIKDISATFDERQHAREIAIEHVQWLRKQRPAMRPGIAVLPVRNFVVEHPCTSWSDVVEVYARAHLAHAPVCCAKCGHPLAGLAS